MAERLVESVVAVVTDLEQSVFHTKRIREVVARVVIANFRRPAVEGLAVEDRDPLIDRELVSRGQRSRAARNDHERNKAAKQSGHDALSVHEPKEFDDTGEITQAIQRAAQILASARVPGEVTSCPACRMLDTRFWMLDLQ